MAKREHEEAYEERAAEIDAHYSAREEPDPKARKYSPIHALKQVNNFVKRRQLLSSIKRGDWVLDLAIGKGGDVHKMADANAAVVAGVDVAKRSVQEHATERYNNGPLRRQDGFTLRLFHGDAFSGDLQAALAEESMAGQVFDVASVQFALHYAFFNEQVARSAVKNAATALRPGGKLVGTTVDASVMVKRLRQNKGLGFGNSVYRAVFSEQHSSKRFDQSDGAFGIEYEFTLSDAIDGCKEWLVHKATLQRIAQEEGLDLTHWDNFHTHISSAIDSNEEARNSFSRHLSSSNLDEDQWEAAGLYCVFEFVKRSDVDPPPRPEPPKKRALTSEDVHPVPPSSHTQQPPR